MAKTHSFAVTRPYRITNPQLPADTRQGGFCRCNQAVVVLPQTPHLQRFGKGMMRRGILVKKLKGALKDLGTVRRESRSTGFPGLCSTSATGSLRKAGSHGPAAAGP
jgi:hypothetical protein